MEYSYIEICRMQSKIVELQEILQEQISYRDEKGNRKLNPRFFLSGEVAAYKLLSYWIKQMRKQAELNYDEVRQTLLEVEGLIDNAKLDFSLESTVAAYEEMSQVLWYEVFDFFFDGNIAKINKEIANVFMFAQVFSHLYYDTEILYSEIQPWQMADDVFMGEIYVETHNLLMGMSQDLAEKVLSMAQATELYREHFNLF